MGGSPELDNLRELAAQFELLRDKLTRTARAIALVEDRRAERLLKVARGGVVADGSTLVDDAQQARLNAYAAAAIAEHAERMARSAHVSEGDQAVRRDA